MCYRGRPARIRNLGFSRSQCRLDRILFAAGNRGGGPKGFAAITKQRVAVLGVRDERVQSLAFDGSISRGLFAGLGLALVVSGCTDAGLSGRDAEWERVSNKPFHFVSVNHERAVVSARGRQVAIEAAL